MNWPGFDRLIGVDMQTVSKTAKDVGIVLAVTGALVLGFGARASADPAPNPTSLAVDTSGCPCNADGTPIPLYGSDGTLLNPPAPVAPVVPTVPAPARHRYYPQPKNADGTTIPIYIVTPNGSLELVTREFTHGILR